MVYFDRHTPFVLLKILISTPNVELSISENTPQQLQRQAESGNHYVIIL